MEKEAAAQHNETVTSVAVRTHHAYAEEHVEGLEVPKVTWWKHKGLRKLYAMMPILFLGATINGYDSSLLNGLQTLKPWQNCRSF